MAHKALRSIENSSKTQNSQMLGLHILRAVRRLLACTVPSLELPCLALVPDRSLAEAESQVRIISASRLLSRDTGQLQII